MRRGLRLILVTGQRPGECFGLVGEEISGEWWTLPAGRSKNGREHRIWLSPMAREIIGPGPKGLVFPSPPKKRDPDAVPTLMQKDAPARAVRRLVNKQKGQTAPRLPIPPFTPHDLRRTCATHLGSLGYSNEQIGRLLNHIEGMVMAIYNRHRYDNLVQEMLQAWEERLAEILGRGPT